MIRRLYDWCLSMADHRYALWVLAVVSFAESSFFPIPPDVLLIPMVLAAPHRAWLNAGVCTVASVLGGIAGYGIGMYALEPLGEPLLRWAGKEEFLTQFSTFNEAWGLWVVFGAGLTPFPYKVVTIYAGATTMNFWVFVLSSIVARGLRFFLVAGLLWKFGPPVRDFIEKRLGLLFTLFVILLVGSFALVRFL